jgi:fused signal recognition particle receptor
MFSFLKRPGEAPGPENDAAQQSWRMRLKQGLSRTRNTLNTPVSELLRRPVIDDELLEELEATLLMADCGIEATGFLLAELKARVKRERIEDPARLQGILADILTEVLQPLEQQLDVSGHKPFIIMIAGVNGCGKTTSIGKLAYHFQAEGKSVLLAAGDTFRAAAREQLVVWGERNNVMVVSQDGGDPAAVIFDAINAAKARNIDIVLADTAGRLPTQLHLMEEIAKVKRVIAKADPTGPHEVMLVLDANIGQNALAQVKAFDAAIGVTGLIVTKLDGTAKGGVIAGIARAHGASHAPGASHPHGASRPQGARHPLALRYIGVGEGIDDLQPFSAREFADALFAPQELAAAQ